MNNNNQHILQKLQTVLIREKKLSAIGKLTAGIVHNLNTPISIIQGNSELLNLKYPDMPEIEMIMRQTERVNTLLHELGVKSRNSLNDQPVEFDLNDLIQNELKFMEGNLYFKHYINVEFKPDKKIPKINGSYSDFSLIVSSLLKNAVDAMYKQETRDLVINTTKTSGYIIFKVKDSGTGMNEDVRSKLFDPLFTTKPGFDDVLDDKNIPRGLGIDLYLAEIILKKYKIELELNTAPGQGSEFILNIPAEFESV